MNLRRWMRTEFGWSSDLLEVMFDDAVIWVGRYVEAKLEETQKVKNILGETEIKPKYTLKQLLEGKPDSAADRLVAFAKATGAYFKSDTPH